MKNQKSIVMILTNAFDPDMRVYKEARYLIEKGYSVEILCWDRENKRQEIEYLDGIRIKRFYPKAIYGTGLKQLRPFYQFIKECKKYLQNKDVDFLHCHDLDGIVCGSRLRKNKTKLIFDMHEFYEARSSNRHKNRLIRRLVNHYLKKVDHVIYVNDIQKENLTKSIQDKFLYLPNYPYYEDFKDVHWSPAEKLRISYIGSVRQFEQLNNLIEVAETIKDVQVSIHGAGVALMKLKKSHQQARNTILTGHFDGREISKFYAETDVHYIIYNRSAFQYLIAMPVKFFESIVTMTPMIVGKDTILEEFVKKYDVGFVVNGDDKEEIRALLEKLSRNKELVYKKRDNFRDIRLKYTWESVVTVLDEIYPSN